jgi:hypothetical protein
MRVHQCLYRIDGCSCWLIDRNALWIRRRLWIVPSATRTASDVTADEDSSDTVHRWTQERPNISYSCICVVWYSAAVGSEPKTVTCVHIEMYLDNFYDAAARLVLVCIRIYGRAPTTVPCFTMDESSSAWILAILLNCITSSKRSFRYRAYMAWPKRYIYIYIYVFVSTNIYIYIYITIVTRVCVVNVALSELN